MAENGSRHGQGGTPQRSWDFYGKQIEMLKEAYVIETKYTADQLFSSVSSSKLTKEELEEVRRFSAEEMNTLSTRLSGLP